MGKRAGLVALWCVACGGSSGRSPDAAVIAGPFKRPIDAPVCTDPNSFPCTGTYTGDEAGAFTCTRSFGTNVSGSKTTFTFGSASGVFGATADFAGTPAPGPVALEANDMAFLSTAARIYNAVPAAMTLTLDSRTAMRMGGTPGEWCLHGTLHATATNSAKMVVVDVLF